MEITIKGKPKEIAALVVGLQGRLLETVSKKDVEAAIQARLGSKDPSRTKYE